MLVPSDQEALVTVLSISLGEGVGLDFLIRQLSAVSTVLIRSSSSLALAAFRAIRAAVVPPPYFRNFRRSIAYFCLADEGLSSRVIVSSLNMGDIWSLDIAIGALWIGCEVVHFFGSQFRQFCLWVHNYFVCVRWLGSKNLGVFNLLILLASYLRSLA